MNVLGLVTARGGSKGFPGKNLALLAGRPLVAWSHRALAALRDRHAGLHLRLSTDSRAIAEAWPEGDRPHDLRPAHLAEDDSSSLDVALYELDRMAARGTPCDAVLLLQPTSPLLGAGDLDAMWAAYEAGHASVLAVAETPHPLAWAWNRAANGVLSPALPQSSDARRQDAPKAWLPVGAYLVSAEFLRSRRAFAAPDATFGVPVAPWRAVDIDAPEDLERAAMALERAQARPAFALGGRTIGPGHPCFVIAEAGVNHGGNLHTAKLLVHAAARSGADAIKFQTFRASNLVTRNARKADYQVRNTGGEESQYEMLAKLEFAPDDFRQLKAEAERHGLVFLSTPFDAESVELLANLNVDGFKLGSGEITNLPMLEQIARHGRPLLLSTGMSTLDEVERAAAHFRACGGSALAVLHCVSCYPAPIGDTNLRAMDSLRAAVGGPAGMSDHSLGWEVALAAVARGACVLEKHLTLDRAMPGPDHAASLEPHEFAQMMKQIRHVEAALGSGVKVPAPCERDTREVARKSLVAARDLPAGKRIEAADFAAKRPGTGLEPVLLEKLVGRALALPLHADEPVTWGHLA
ncbi:MAG: N-acetylneuraminate synthase [Planctomycetota bacterium]|nr:N-acetylneuraminate synthase [Planctomycetota bacterium]